MEKYERRIDPRENIYFWLAGLNNHRELEPGTDYWAVHEGYISLTPIHHDLTDYDTLKELNGNKWLEELM